MITTVINGFVLKLYDSIEDMPIENFQKYNKYLLIDAGIGSDVNDIDAHIAKIAKYINADNKKEALQELINTRKNLYMVNSNISPKHLAFAALIHSINGNKVTDLSDDNLKKVLSDIREIKRSTIADFLYRLKKKVQAELETYFPNSFSASAKDREAYDKVKRRTILELESIINSIDNSDNIKAIDAELFMLYHPKSFDGSGSVEVQYDKSYQNALLLISKELNLDTKNMSTLQFYNALELIKKQYDERSKSLKQKGNGRR